MDGAQYGGCWYHTFVEGVEVSVSVGKDGMPNTAAPPKTTPKARIVDTASSTIRADATRVEDHSFGQSSDRYPAGSEVDGADEVDLHSDPIEHGCFRG